MEIVQIQEKIRQYGYEYKEFLGKGSCSCVVLCHSHKYNQQFALKRAAKHRISLHEYEIMTSLIHPNIISLYDTFEDDKYTYLVMDYCSNGTIRSKIKLSYENFIVYAKQMLDALSYCHSNNVAHRDIKPENIFLDQYDHVKLGDFGFSKQFQDNAKSAEKCGTMACIAPEMFQYHEVCPFKADIWALGITFFFMVTGHFPFQSPSIEKMKQEIIFGDLDYFDCEVDKRIRFLISKMTQKNPASRPTADKLLDLPMFHATLSKNMLQGFKNSRRNSCPNKIFNMQAIIDMNQCKPSDDNDAKRLSLLTAHCYKSLLVSQKKFKISNHHRISKPL